MILTDFSQVSIAALHQQIKPSKNGVPEEVNPAMLRHMILNSIRKVNRKFRNQYGQMVICTDNHNYWRKSAFRFYKSNRKKDRDASGIDWNLVFQILNELRIEIASTFPYKVMDVPMAEADDVIGILCKHFHPQGQIIIISGDHDFLQLQKYPGIDQYSPVRDEFLHTSDPVRFLKEHILRGDKGDGVPNFLSDDDCIATGKRQSPIYEVKLNAWLDQNPEEFCDERTLNNFKRNKTMVDLSEIPADVEQSILDEFGKPIVGSRNKIYSYLIKHRLKNLLEFVRDF